MDVEVTFDTCIWHYMRTYTNGGDRIFPIGQRRTGKAELELKNATYTIFSQPKIECSKLFKLKTDGDTIWNDSPVSHNRKSRELHKELKSKRNQEKVLQN